MFPKIDEPNQLETPLGPASEVWATSETHIGMRGQFTVNRVLYDVRLDLRFRDGEWKEGEADDNWSSIFHALMIDRADWNWNKGRRPDTSAAARKKAREALVPWLAGFAVSEEGAALVSRAGCEDRQRKIAGLQKKVKDLLCEVEQAEKELAELQN